MSCFWCHSDYSELCTKCGLVSSCPFHWTLHQSKNKKLCFPLKIVEDEIRGRRVVAVRDIDQMEVIMEDVPVSIGPVHSTTPLCLTCYNHVSLEYFCDICGFPMCDETCAQSSVHQIECTAFKDAGVRVKIQHVDQPCKEYQSIMVLRLVLAGEVDRARTDLLCCHTDKLGKLEIDVYRETVIRVIREKLGIKQFSEEELLRYLLYACEIIISITSI